MALTLADLEDVRMKAREKIRKYRMEHDEKFFKPLRDSQIGMMWNGLEPRVKEQLRKTNPEAAAFMDKRYGGKNGNSV